MNAPLAGLRVLDLTRLLPGPLATRRLAEWGAEVVKIEGRAGAGQDDEARVMWQTPDEAAAGAPSLFFRLLNEGKGGQRIDLRSVEGRGELLAMARDADVLVEGFRPGVMERLGLGWAALHAANPRLVVCAITGYGQRGPWAQRAGHDINYIAVAGLLHQIVDAEGPEADPALPNFQVADLLGGTQAALSGLLAALVGALRTGQGRYVDISMAHEVWRHLVVPRVGLAVTGRAVPGRELLSGGSPCYGVYRTQDGRHLAVGALEHRFWLRLCEAVDRPAWAPQHWTLGLPVGSAEALALRDALAELLASQPLDHWAALFDAADCCVTPVLSPEEAARHPLFRAPPATAADEA